MCTHTLPVTKSTLETNEILKVFNREIDKKNYMAILELKKNDLKGQRIGSTARLSGKKNKI